MNSLFPDNFLHDIYGNLFDTIISLVVIALVYFLFYFFAIRKISNARQKQKSRIRAFYVACVVFVFVMAHVWVNGFTHLVAILGLVSAGLVVTNKETIMNFVGWLVITWRGLFSEEDLIQIQQYKGYVKRIGVLYFTLYEVSDTSGNITGRVIRVPNGLTSNNALVNYSQTSHVLEQRFTISVSPNNDFDYLKQTLKTVVDDLLAEFYKSQSEFTADYLSKSSKQLLSRIKLGVNVSLSSKTDNLSSLELLTRYFCFSQDADKIRERVLLAFLEVIKNDPKVKMA
ncbi:MAG: mechanosensitive ion channel [Gammaproteobacteria bacterium]|nr:mechanosensitive ion channel [Gammaproteobacteria bacterium]